MSSITTFPVPPPVIVRSALDGAVNVEPTAVRSPNELLLPEVTAVPPGVTPSPILISTVTVSSKR